MLLSFSVEIYFSVVLRLMMFLVLGVLVLNCYGVLVQVVFLFRLMVVIIELFFFYGGIFCNKVFFI